MVSIDRSTALIVFLLLLPVVAWTLLRHRQQRPPTLAYSSLDSLPLTPPSWRLRLASLPTYLLWSSVLLFALALPNPRWETTVYPEDNTTPIAVPTEGVALFLLLDQSGSMSRSLILSAPEGGEQVVSKIEYLRAMTEQLIRRLPNDLIGLISFARTAQVVSPLTLDHEALIDALRRVRVVRTQELDGTGIGYAIYKTVSLMEATRHFASELKSEKPSYTVRDRAIVVITDGFQSINERDKGNWLRTIGLEDAATYAHDHQVRLYFVTIEPALLKEEFGPHRRLLDRVAKMTGGYSYIAADPQEIEGIYRSIETLEKSKLPLTTLETPLPQPIVQTLLSFAPLLILSGLLCLFSSVALASTVLRRTP